MVKDANGCTKSSSIVITQPTSNLSANVASGSIACNGGTTTVTVTATGGTAPYTGTGTFTVSAGVHSYTVTDANGITNTTSINTTQPTLIAVASSAGTITTLGGTTSITVTATGGTAPYTYALNAGAYQSSNILSNVPAGTHTIMVKDANGCTKSSIITIIISTSNTLVVNAVGNPISCFGSTTLVTVSATGGTAPYTGTGTFVMSAGTRIFTVRDANGYTQNTTITMSQPSEIIVNVHVANDVTSLNETAEVTINASGGAGNYRYALDGDSSQSSPIFTAVYAGNHFVTVVDSNGCIKTTAFSVNLITNSGYNISLISKSNVSCKGAQNGMLEVLASAGRAPYTYALGSGTYDTISKFYDLNAGIYRVYAKDANNNIVNIIVIIEDGIRNCSDTASQDPMILNVYPNPSPQSQPFTLKIDSKVNTDVTLDVIDVLGNRIFKDNGAVNKVYHFGQNFKPGSYFVRVIQGKKITTTKIIKL